MDLVTYDVAEGVARIGLDRPDVSNSVDLPTALALDAAVERAASDLDVRVVLLTGAGPRFCAGGDLSSMVASDDQPAYLLELANALDGALQKLASLEKPVVAAVQGAVAGAGNAVMLSCDLVVAGESTKFVFAYPGVGLTPDCGLSWLLPRAVGQQRALQFALGGRPLSAAQALDWGMVTEVVADDAVQDRATALAASLAGDTAYALGQARRLLRASWETTRAEAGAEESRTIAAAVVTPQAQELIGAFTSR